MFSKIYFFPKKLYKILKKFYFVIFVSQKVFIYYDTQKFGHPDNYSSQMLIHSSWTQVSHPCYPPQSQLQSCTLCNSWKNTNNTQHKELFTSLSNVALQCVTFCHLDKKPMWRISSTFSKIKKLITGPCSNKYLTPRETC